MGIAVSIALVSGALGYAEPWAAVEAGAVVTFDGVVRSLEADRVLAALIYEAYSPMAEQELERLASSTAEKHGLSAIYVDHSVGRVAPGEVSFRLRVAARHRKAAICAMDEFIDEMKQRVPIWKVPEWAQP